MNWIDIRVRKPAEKDADNIGNVFVKFSNSVFDALHFSEAAVRRGVVAWMPIPEFTPLPDPPDGYRLIDPLTEPFDERALCWSESLGSGWGRTNNNARLGYDPESIYCVPIEPPAPVIPEPPDGYRLVDVERDPFDKQAMYWTRRCGSGWAKTYSDELTGYDPNFIYCVPIDPPKPKYRSFASMDEIEPHIDKAVRRKGTRSIQRIVFVGAHYVVLGGDNSEITFDTLFDRYTFKSGTPCGVPVEQ